MLLAETRRSWALRPQPSPYKDLARGSCSFQTKEFKGRHNTMGKQNKQKKCIKVKAHSRDVRMGECKEELTPLGFGQFLLTVAAKIFIS